MKIRSFTLLACLPVLAFSLGYLSRHRIDAWRSRSPIRNFLGPGLRGGDSLRWRPSQVPEDAGRDLSALGYLQGYSPASNRSGVTIHEPLLAWEGANLYVSGHGPTATLIGMDGENLHEWTASLEDICPESFDPDVDASHFFRRARVLGDGSLLVVFEYRALAKIDRDSRLIWKRCAPYHHDVVVDESGRLFALARTEGSLRPPLEHVPILDDEIHVLSAEGEVVERISVLDLLADSEYRAIALRVVDGVELERTGDVFHTNSVRLLPESRTNGSTGSRAGDLLISIRNLDTIAIVDLLERRIEWALTGPWHGQHDATMLSNGNILLFDNMGLITLDPVRRSRVIELEPATGEIVWSYDGRPDGGFGSTRCGSTQRLPNGNTLVTVTEEGRAFEVTAGGEVVWEFWNPHRAGHDGELIASLFDVIRLAPEEVGWLEDR